MHNVNCINNLFIALKLMLLNYLFLYFRYKTLDLLLIFHDIKLFFLMQKSQSKSLKNIPRNYSSKLIQLELVLYSYNIDITKRIM